MMHQLKEHRWIAAVVSVMLVLGLVALCHRPKSYESGRSLPVGEAFDSLTSMLPKGSTIIARFPDDQKEEEKPKQQATKKADVPVITDPLPEAAFADEPVGAGHEVKAEPKKTEPENKPEVTTISTD